MKQCLICGKDSKRSLSIAGIGFVCSKCHYVLGSVAICPICGIFVNKHNCVDNVIVEKDKMVYYHHECHHYR